jgi:hypothetical protein
VDGTDESTLCNTGGYIAESLPAPESNAIPSLALAKLAA